MFIHHVSAKELISKVHKELSKLNSKKKTIQLQNGLKKTWTDITEEDIQMLNKHMNDIEHH